jgi:hypothetical protein
MDATSKEVAEEPKLKILVDEATGTRRIPLVVALW